MISQKYFPFCPAVFLFIRCFAIISCLFVSGCVQPGPPKLPDTQPEVANKWNTTKYSRALSDMNILLDVYLPPEQNAIFYYIKPIYDKTNISSTGGEIPNDMGDIVRASFGDIHNKIRILEQYTADDQAQVLVAREKGIYTSEQAVRPNPDFIISGSISIFDRGLESVSRTPKMMGNSLGAVDVDASTQKEMTKSHLGVILLVSNREGVSFPGRFGGEMDVWNGKDGVDVGFAIKGIGFGYAAQGVAIQGRHQALQLISDLSAVQIVGRTLSLPYWRVPLNQTTASSKIYDEDEIVYRDWQVLDYLPKLADGSLISSMQAACIANGDDSVRVNGHADDPVFQNALARFADKYQVREQVNRQYGQYPSFELYKALELNRILDRNRAALAWNALSAFQRSTHVARSRGFQLRHDSPEEIKMSKSSSSQTTVDETSQRPDSNPIAHKPKKGSPDTTESPANGQAVDDPYQRGINLYYGRGCQQDYTQAMSYLLVSAGQGNSKAQSTVGFMYLTGLGGPKNRTEAVKWTCRAAEKGDKTAKERLDRMREESGANPCAGER